MLLNAQETRYLITGQDIPTGYIGRNEHLSQIGHDILFQDAERQFLDRVEINDDYIADTHCDVYAIEDHCTHFTPVYKDTKISISSQILDLTNMSLHLIFIMKDMEDVQLASRERLYLHGSIEFGRLKSSPFGRYQLSNLIHNFSRDKTIDPPAYSCRSIAIRREV